MRKGKWITAVREKVLAMNQKQFATFLSENTGIGFNSNKVQRIEKWGKTDTKRKIRLFTEPDKKVVRFLELLCLQQAGDTFFPSQPPQFFCYPALFDPTPYYSELLFRAKDKGKHLAFSFRVISARSKEPIAKAKITAYLDDNYQEPIGPPVWTDANGEATIHYYTKDKITFIRVRHLLVFAQLHRHWNLSKYDLLLTTNSPFQIELEALLIPRDFQSSIVPFFYSASSQPNHTNLKKLKVGIIEGVRENPFI